MSARDMRIKSVLWLILANLLVFVAPHIWHGPKLECRIAGLSALIVAIVYEVGGAILKRLETKS